MQCINSHAASFVNRVNAQKSSFQLIKEGSSKPPQTLMRTRLHALESKGEGAGLKRKTTQHSDKMRAELGKYVSAVHGVLIFRKSCT